MKRVFFSLVNLLSLIFCFICIAGFCILQGFAAAIYQYFQGDFITFALLTLGVIFCFMIICNYFFHEIETGWWKIKK
jgi:formate hydrogenlyase subunit 3/multisubunit Na+/H+ antiporter MnhD subunit